MGASVHPGPVSPTSMHMSGQAESTPCVPHSFVSPLEANDTTVACTSCSKGLQTSVCETVCVRLCVCAHMHVGVNMSANTYL